MWRLEVSSEAEVEIFEAALRYERERIGLGVRFETQVNTVFARLVDNPFQFPVIEEGVRRAIVGVFPYAAYFTSEADLIVLTGGRVRLAAAPADSIPTSTAVGK